MPVDSAHASAALFDHERSSHAEAPRGRRRRPAPDWGGDDLFDHVPRRRFARGPEDRRRSGAVAAPARGVRQPAPAAPEATGAPAAQPRPPAVQELITARRAEYEYETPPPAGRRTVTVTGHPGTLAAPRTAGPARRRGPRSVEERISARPDLIAGYACGLGLLASIIALLS
jgi:hypothetical protein